MESSRDLPQQESIDLGVNYLELLYILGWCRVLCPKQGERMRTHPALLLPRSGLTPKRNRNKEITNSQRREDSLKVPVCSGTKKEFLAFSSNPGSPCQAMSLNGRRLAYMPTRMDGSSSTGERIQSGNTSHTC